MKLKLKATTHYKPLNLMEETLLHFEEGARSVVAYAQEQTMVITRVQNSDAFWIAVEEQGFAKTKTDALEPFFNDVFGIEAKY